MDPLAQFLCQQVMDQAMAVHPTAAGEGGGDDVHREVGLAGAVQGCVAVLAQGCHAWAVGGMAVGVVADDQGLGRQTFHQFAFDARANGGGGCHGACDGWGRRLGAALHPLLSHMAGGRRPIKGASGVSVHTGAGAFRALASGPPASHSTDMVAQGRKLGAHGTAFRRHGYRAPFDADDLGVGATGAETPAVPVCDHPGCSEAGEFRAPRDRSLSSYFHFCLEHVRAYNKAWNYYANMNSDEIEQQVRCSTVWDRPTWRMGGAGPSRFDPRAFKDPLGAFEAMSTAPDDGPGGAEPSPFPRDSREAKALRDMELTWPLTRDELRARYRVLVKRHHPDANNGDKAAEERFKRVSEAYRVLLAAVVA